MMGILLLLVSAILGLLASILGEIKKVERKIDELKAKPKHESFWGKGTKK